jgi:hypothetical protein
MEMNRMVAALIGLSLAGCAQTTGGKAGASADDLARETAECQNEIPAAEASYAEALTRRGYTAALDNMRSDAAAHRMFLTSLMRLCLLSRGYKHVDMDALSAIEQSVPAPPTSESP